MGKFTDELQVAYLNDINRWRILRGFEFHMGEKDSGLFIRVRVGDTTDFFSIPFIVRWLMPKSSRGNQAAAFHDKGYQTGMLTVRIGTETKDVMANKAAIDSMFLDGMKVLDFIKPIKSNDSKMTKFKYWLRKSVRFVRRQLVYRAVQFLGFFAWNRYRRIDRMGR